MIRRVPLPLESKLAGEAIDNASHPPSLQLPLGFSRPLAWELANLIRVAYGDFDKYDKQQDLDNLIQVGDTLWLPPNLTYDPIDHFWLQHASDDPIDSGETDAGPIGDSTAYKVLDVFTIWHLTQAFYRNQKSIDLDSRWRGTWLTEARKLI